MAKGRQWSLHTFRAEVDYAEAEALTTYGIIGVKVWSYKGAVFSGNSKNKERSPTYHFIRKDRDGWSHKNATDNISKYDANDNLIQNPEEANFNYPNVNYSNFCNYFCIPEKK